jgi:putative ABC transport system permease protein
VRAGPKLPPLSEIARWNNLLAAGDAASMFTEMPPANYRFCSPGYFQAAGLKFAAGRAFSDADSDKRRVVISEATARLLWPGESAVGRQFNQGGDSEKEPYEVVGVVRDVSVGLGERAVPTVYQAYWAITFRSSMNVVLHTEGDPMSVARSIRQAVWSLNADTVVDKIDTMDGVVSDSVASRRFQTILTAGFAGSALLLACVGIYGVVAWSVARRRNEIGIRMALGARSADVHRLIIVQGLRPVLAGLAAGLLGALALGQVLGSVLFGVSARDPLTFGVVAVTLAGVAALACYVPAHRATRTDPLRALRYE